MNVLLGFVNATAGDAFLFDVNVRQPIARQRIGYLPELTYYYKFLTAEELLRFYARIFGIPRGEADRRIDQLMKLVELEGARKRPIKTYSKGMQQRVGLAQALINNPDLLILDEPTSGLDPLGRMKVREIIQRLKNEGKTVFFSSHELGEVETVCDRVAIIDAGQIIALGTPRELQDKSATQSAIEATLSRPLEETVLPQWPESIRAMVSEDRHRITVYSQRPARTLVEMVKWIDANGIELDDVHLSRPTLEDVFIELTGKKLRD